MNVRPPHRVRPGSPSTPRGLARRAVVVASLAAAGAAAPLAAQPAAVGASDTLARGTSRWDGAWVLDTARSGPEARDGAADGYVFHLQPDGRIRWEIPSLGEVVTGRTDGRPMPVRRPGAPPGLTLAVRRDGPTVLRYAVARNGTPLGEGRMTLVEGGRAWVDLTWPAGRPEQARVVVYARRPRDHAAAPSSQGLPVRERLAAQDRLFQRQFAADTASVDGEPPLAAAARQHAADSAYRAELLAIAPDGFPEQDRLSHDLLLDVLAQRLADYALQTSEMPLTQMDGVHLALARSIPTPTEFRTARDYEDYAARLRRIPRDFADATAVLRQGMRDGLMPPHSLLAQVPAQCAGIVAENPFLGPVRRFPAAVPEGDRQRLTREIEAAVVDSVLPAYRRFAAFVADEYAPRGRAAPGLGSLPDGARRYQHAIRAQTSTDLTPAEVYALGIREVARITGLLTELARRAGYPDLARYRAALAADPRYTPTSPEQIVDDFRRDVDRMRPRLPELFTAGDVSDVPIVVEAIPASQPGDATHYVRGAPDGSRPARVLVASSDFARRSLLSDEAQAYHEGIPGHHLQIGVQQRLTGLPDFRRGYRNAAYTEGWAVYAEALGKDVGGFRDPASDYGRLNLELLRAVRLVVDPGLHAFGWSRDSAVAYLRASGAASEPLIQAEVDRYIAWPAQGLSYKVGQLKFLELRERARRRLGPRFDVRAFHHAVLAGGPLPLHLLDAAVDRWVDRQLQTSAAAR